MRLERIPRFSQNVGEGVPPLLVALRRISSYDSSSLKSKTLRNPNKVDAPAMLPPPRWTASGIIAAAIIVSIAPAASPSIPMRAVCDTESLIKYPTPERAAIMTTSENHMR